MENDISEYLNNGIHHIVSDVLQHTLENPKETGFLLSFFKQSKRAERVRSEWENKGTHIPVFLILSIAHSCNLFCKGCYARKNGICGENDGKELLSDSDWVRIFDQAANLGIGFQLLAWGEPLTRRGVLELAGARKNTVFPIFTMRKITSEDFISMLEKSGCRLIFFIEYVPVEPGTESLAFRDEDREQFESYRAVLQEKHPSVLFLSFPGDEEKMGGCLAGGRGFFHVNPYGDAEPCPFSPYSDCSVKDHTLLEALQSQLFKKLDEQKLNGEGHSGGCALFEQREQVAALCREE